MTVAQNLMLGRNPKGRLGLLDRAAQNSVAQRALDRVGAHFTEDALVMGLSMANQQLVAIAKALTMDARLLVMDEPSASLEQTELLKVFSVIRDFVSDSSADGGRSVIYITHRLQEVMEICDRATVFRNGRTVGTFDIDKVSESELVAAMIGENRALVERAAANDAQAFSHDVIFQVNGVRIDKKLDVENLEVRRGEVVGIAGLGGSGRTELLRALFGLDGAHIDALLNGQPYSPSSAREAIAAGIGFVPEDRRTQGLILLHSIVRNAALAALRGRFSIGPRRLDRMTAPTLESLGLRAANRWQSVGSLSGGNQQKVVLAKWLVRGAQVLLLDEPSRGLDVGAKADLYQQIRDLAARGSGIIVVSSEIEELLANCDIVWVLHEGRNTEVFDARTCNHDEVMRAVVAGPEHANRIDEGVTTAATGGEQEATWTGR
jgi:ribose transport system ATP-binding protein